MIIENGQFVLTYKKDKEGPHITIGRFFTSLVLQGGSKAIGMTLSGTGTDGSKGAAAISLAILKESGFKRTMYR